MDHLLEIPRRSRDHPDIDGPVSLPADSAHGAGLEDTQQAGLEAEGHLTDLVQQQRAAMGLLKQPRMSANSPGERAALVAEQLALEQTLRDRTTVHRNERLGCSARPCMECACKDLLSRSGLSIDEDGGRVRRDLLDHLGHPLGSGTPTDKTLEGFGHPDSRTQPRVLFAELVALHQTLDGNANLVRTKWLRDVVRCPSPERLYRGVRGAVCTHHDHLQPPPADRIEKAHAIHPGHPNIAQNKADLRVCIELSHTVCPVAGCRDLIAEALEHRGQNASEVVLIIDDQNLRAMRAGQGVGHPAKILVRHPNHTGSVNVRPPEHHVGRARLPAE